MEKDIVVNKKEWKISTYPHLTNAMRGEVYNNQCFQVTVRAGKINAAKRIIKAAKAAYMSASSDYKNQGFTDKEAVLQALRDELAALDYY